MFIIGEFSINYKLDKEMKYIKQFLILMGKISTTVTMAKMFTIHCQYLLFIN